MKPLLGIKGMRQRENRIVFDSDVMKQLLKNAVADQHGYVLLFYESLNKTHNKQMDIHCRFWGNDRQVQIIIIILV